MCRPGAYSPRHMAVDASDQTSWSVAGPNPEELKALDGLLITPNSLRAILLRQWPDVRAVLVVSSRLPPCLAAAVSTVLGVPMAAPERVALS